MSGPVGFSEFWTLFWQPILASLMAAALCGYLGFFVVVRRVAFVSAALGQISGLGVAFGFLLGSALGHEPHASTPAYLDPVVLALLLAGAASAALGYVAHVQRTSPESIIAFVYLAATSLALIVLSSPLIIQEAHEVGDLLFGNTVAVRREHLLELVIIAAVVFLSHALLFKDLLFISFDAQMAKTLGLPVVALELWLLISIGVSVAVATRAIGALPVFGFLVLPAGAAVLVSESVATVLGFGVAGAMLAAVSGFYLSFIESWPTGPTMVICASAYWPMAAIAWLARRRRNQ